MSTRPHAPAHTPLPRATVADQVRVAARLLLPALAEGLVQRRRRPMALAERHQADRAAIDTVRDLRARYGDGPLRLRAAGRSVALLLDPADMARVLRETPEPFSPATREKRRALDQFQPHGSLITRGGLREERRRLNERALQTGRELHEAASAMATRVRQEAAEVTGRAVSTRLTWDLFAEGWWRSVRRVVLGEAARDDTDLTDRLASLRAAGNWSMLAPRHRRARADFLLRVQRRAFQAPPDTLAGHLRAAGVSGGAGSGAGEGAGADPAGQIPHWLFAFDAAGIATLRTLALLSTHPEEAARARGELTATDPSRPHAFPFLRACLLESVRLWPTTPLLLRESTRETTWHGTVIPAGTSFAAFTPYFHRAEPAAPYGDEFVPDVWLDGRAAENPALVPFSAGPGACPGENVVLLVASAWLAALLANHTYLLEPPSRLHPHQPVPATLDHFPLRFTVTPG